MIASNFGNGPDGNPIRILHLEDSAQDHVLVCIALKCSATIYQLERVDSLKEFNFALKNQYFDVILADYHLLGFTALEAWALVPEDFRGPFILLSGAIGESAAVAAIQSGISDYLHKDELQKLPRIIERSMATRLAGLEKISSDRELLESKLRITQFANHLQDTIERERASIAREIHDDIGGSLAAIRLDLSWAARHVSDPHVLARIDTAGLMLQHALGASQRIMRNLRPAILDQGLAAAARWLAHDFERRTRVNTQFKDQHCRQTHTSEVQLAAYRTIQEALTNILKYSGADLVSIDLSDVDNVLTVEITDNGKGITPTDRSKMNAFGLRGLEERANSVGGWLDVSSATGKGTSVILSVPILQTSGLR